MSRTRDAYWDNVKAVLIFFVVFGHFLLPVSTIGKAAPTVYHWIYLFHMPAFIFVSGYFSKSYVRKDNKEYKLTGLLAIYVLFTVATWVVQFIFTRQFDPNSLLSTSGAPWYMLAMFFWFLMLPFVSRWKVWFSFPFFIVLAIAAGRIPSCGNFLMLSRTIVFFPFFLAGYYFNGDIIRKITPWIRLLAAGIMIAAGVILYYYFDQTSEFTTIAFGNSSYEKLGFSDEVGMPYRAIWYVVSTVMSAALLCLVPRKRFFFTYIGERTLAIYVLHRLLRDTLQGLGLYQYLGSGAVLVAECMVIAVIVVFIASPKPFTVLLNRCFRLRFLLKQQTGKEGQIQ